MKITKDNGIYTVTRNYIIFKTTRRYIQDGTYANFNGVKRFINEKGMVTSPRSNLVRRLNAYDRRF